LEEKLIIPDSFALSPAIVLLSSSVLRKRCFECV